MVKALLEFLSAPASYPHSPNEVRMTETHISWVFFASPFVFKVKKPVDLGFADFSTLEKRRYFCEREVELNRRLSSDMYLGVVPIHQSGIGYSFEAEGEIVEHAVKMRELAKGFFLNELLAKNAVGENEIARVLARLRDFYEGERPTCEIEAWGRVEKLRISTDENFAQVEPFVGKTISAAAFEAVRYFTDNFYATNAALFAERVAQQRILDCHGDLRLDHVHLTPETVTVFDCIEFNDRFRFIDVANDLAFLAMDFDFAHAHSLGRIFLERAAAVLDDPGILRLADFYKCYRAFVRGKVESFQMSSSETAEGRARRYFQLALRYAVAGSNPAALVVMGGIATGKSTLAAKLGAELDWPVFSSDSIRKSLARVSLTRRTPEELRSKVYTGEMNERTYRRLFEEGFAALKTYSGVILEATFSTRAMRNRLREKCSRNEVGLEFIELTADAETVRQRLRARAEKSDVISDARLEDFEKLTRAYESPDEGEVLRARSLETVDRTLAAVLRELAERRVAMGQMSS